MTLNFKYFINKKGRKNACYTNTTYNILFTRYLYFVGNLSTVQWSKLSVTSRTETTINYKLYTIFISINKKKQGTLTTSISGASGACFQFQWSPSCSLINFCFFVLLFFVFVFLVVCLFSWTMCCPWIMFFWITVRTLVHLISIFNIFKAAVYYWNRHDSVMSAMSKMFTLLCLFLRPLIAYLF